jgi:uracil-DNA glycosylase
MDEAQGSYRNERSNKSRISNQTDNGKTGIQPRETETIEYCINQSAIIGGIERFVGWANLLQTYQDKILRLQKPIPSHNQIFNMFEFLPYQNVKVVIIGQEPYPSKCNITKINYACGPAFMIPDDVSTCPVSLANLLGDLRRSYNIPKKLSLRYIKDLVKYWISQGVFLTNASLTIGNTSTYLDDHKVFWLQFSIYFVQYLSELKCPIVLLGKEAWRLSKYISGENSVLKFPHPASRNKEFLGCSMFENINKHLDRPIEWIF